MTNTLVSKFRFLEFRDCGEWGIKPLDSLSIKITERNNENSLNRVLTNSAVHGVVDQRDYFEKDIANHTNLDNYFIMDVGDYGYNPRISVTAPVGPISKDKVSKGIISPLYTVFRFKNQNNDFLNNILKLPIGIIIGSVEKLLEKEIVSLISFLHTHTYFLIIENLILLLFWI